jgi:hypothetical protein
MLVYGFALLLVVILKVCTLLGLLFLSAGKVCTLLGLLFLSAGAWWYLDNAPKKAIWTTAVKKKIHEHWSKPIVESVYSIL